jgi:hypothetical protein
MVSPNRGPGVTVVQGAPGAAEQVGQRVAAAAAILDMWTVLVVNLGEIKTALVFEDAITDRGGERELVSVL